jgi:ferric-dicitrate binding protein FerR (iron transport regulator)
VWWAAAALAAGAPAGAASPGATVTAVTGSAAAAGAALERRTTLADGDSLRTGEDGACSILVDGDAVLELCQATTLRLGHRDGRSDGPRVLELRAGEIRVLAEPRAAARRIEIHTPAAIATVLGSAVYVAVDAKGVTTIASAESKVRVESSRRLGRALTLTAGQQLTVRPGAPLPRNAEIWDPLTSPADGCLVDFRAIAFDASRGPGDGNALEKIAAEDASDSLPHVSATSERRWESPVRDDWIDPKLHPIYKEIDTGAVPPPAR